MCGFAFGRVLKTCSHIVRAKDYSFRLSNCILKPFNLNLGTEREIVACSCPGQLTVPDFPVDRYKPHLDHVKDEFGHRVR